MRYLILSLCICLWSCVSEPEVSENHAALCGPIAVAASLDLSPPFTASALYGVVLKARKPGGDGNLIGVAFFDDANGEAFMLEDLRRGRVFVHYQPAVYIPGWGYFSGSQTQDIQALFEDSQLIEFTTYPANQGGWIPTADLQDHEDTFPLTMLSGGLGVCPSF